MSRKLFWLVPLAVAILAAPPAFAKEGKGESGSAKATKDASGGKAKPKPKAEAAAKPPSDEVTADQKKQMDAVDAEAKKSQEPLMAELSVRMKELETLVAERAPDDRLSRKLDQVDLLIDQLEKSRTRARSRKDSLLTPRQRAKALLAMAKGKK